MTLNLFHGHGVIFRPIDALNVHVLSAQLTRDLFAIARFLYEYQTASRNSDGVTPGEINTDML